MDMPDPNRRTANLSTYLLHIRGCLYYHRAITSAVRGTGRGDTSAVIEAGLL